MCDRPRLDILLLLLSACIKRTFADATNALYMHQYDFDPIPGQDQAQLAPEVPKIALF